VWSARWGGSTLLRHDGEGRVVERVTFPVSRVSSATFGGPDLNVLYVTTAGGSALREDPAPEGTLYRFEVDVPGTAPFRSRIRL
jgi:sugar lactone lactonase YvrE